MVTEDVVRQCRVAAPCGQELAKPQECGNGRRRDAKQLQPYPSSRINREGHVRKLPAGIEQFLAGEVLDGAAHFEGRVEHEIERVRARTRQQRQ
jgi:hypothetical protein